MKHGRTATWHPHTNVGERFPFIKLSIVLIQDGIPVQRITIEAPNYCWLSSKKLHAGTLQWHRQIGCLEPFIKLNIVQLSRFQRWCDFSILLVTPKAASASHQNINLQAIVIVLGISFDFFQTKNEEICYSKSDFDLNFTFPFGIFTREQDGRSLGVGMSAFFVQSFPSNIHVCPFVVPPPTCS